MNKPPHFCFVVTSSMTAGTFLPGYLTYFIECGWKVTLVCGDGPELQPLRLIPDLNIRTIPIERNPSPLRDLVALRTLVRVLRSESPDVVAYATPKASLLTSLSATIARVPVRLYHQWGLRLATYSGLKRQVLGSMERITASLSSDIIANSPSLANEYKDMGLNGRTNILVLGAGSSHGVDIERFDRAAKMPELTPETSAFLEETSGFTIGYVGRLHPDKGVDTLLKALQQVSKSSSDFRALFVGNDDGYDVSSVSEGFDSIKVLKVGHVADPRPYYAVLDVLVLPSEREGFPNVVLEAASMGIPAIVSNATGTKDSVSDGETGVIIPVKDFATLANEIDKLRADPELARELGDAARVQVRRQFNSRTVWSLHEEFTRGRLSAPL